jgi:hypothetical protein
MARKLIDIIGSEPDSSLALGMKFGRSSLFAGTNFVALYLLRALRVLRGERKK